MIEAMFQAQVMDELAQREAAFDRGELDGDYAEWLMAQDYRIGNGDALIRLMESQAGLDEFLRGEK